MRFSSRRNALLCATTAGSLLLAGSVCAPAHAQSSLSSSSSSGSSGSSHPSSPSNESYTFPKPPEKRSSNPVTMPDGTIVQVMDDVLGKYSKHVGFKDGDLGAMAPLNNSKEFAMIFGDSFRESIKGPKNEWLSPVGVVAKMNDDGFIEIVRPLNNGRRVESLVSYHHTDNLTLIPSDVINLDGTLYMQGMWNKGIGNVLYTEIWKSTDNGQTWKSISKTPTNYIPGGLGDLITWEKGPDGYVYVMSSAFTRKEKVFLSRFKPQDIADRSKWELYDYSEPDADKKWSNVAAPILSDGVKAGEMNLRYINGHWVLVMFNEEKLAIEVRISDTLEQNWDNVPVATIAKHGSWLRPQNPKNWSQPYGGYIVPGSTIDNMDIVVSQWNTGTNDRYMSTQFNVKGLDTFFGINMDEAIEDDKVLEVEEHAATDTPDMQSEENLVQSKPETLLSSEDNDALRTTGIVLGVVAALGAAGMLVFPYVKDQIPQQVVDMLPPQIRQMLGL